MKADAVVTADLCDALGEAVQVMLPPWRHFGGVRAFQGPAATVRCDDDNSRVRELVGRPGAGRVLVVNGGGSERCALLGDRLGALAVESGWAGVVIHGCVRDSLALAELPLGMVARGTHPRRSRKAGRGEIGATLAFSGVIVGPGDWIYADADGVLVHRGGAQAPEPSSA